MSLSPTRSMSPEETAPVLGLMAALFEDIHRASLDVTFYESFELPDQDPNTDNSTEPDLQKLQADSTRQAAALGTQAMLSVIQLARVCDLSHQQGPSRGGNVSASTRSTKQVESASVLMKEPGLILPLTKQQIRYYEFAQSNGWMLLSICANSQRFRVSAEFLDYGTWNAFSAKIGECSRNIEFFAKLRHLLWKKALAMHDNLFKRAIPQSEWDQNFDWELPIDDHVHHWYLPLEGEPQRKKFNDVDVVNIDRCIYDAKNFTGTVPEDPSIREREFDGPCDVCKEIRDCDCEPEEHRGASAFPEMLMELVEMRGKGIGIRALRRYRAGDYLGEYMGVFTDLNAKRSLDSREWAYALSYSTVGRGEVANLEAHHYGNWTRFLNHSCNSNTDFFEWTAGDRCSVAIKATKDIGMFEEMTVDYGDTYFLNSYSTCLCGEPACKFSGTGSENVRAAQDRRQQEREQAKKKRGEEKLKREERKRKKEEAKEAFASGKRQKKGGRYLRCSKNRTT